MVNAKLGLNGQKESPVHGFCAFCLWIRILESSYNKTDIIVVVLRILESSYDKTDIIVVVPTIEIIVD